ncbi:hypothetical protein ACET3Z_007908 [Daucus carota]
MELPVLLFATSLVLALQFTALVAASTTIQNSFHQCLSQNSDIPIPFSTNFYPHNNSSFTSVLASTAQNLRVKFRLVDAATKGKKTVQTSYNALFLGRTDRLLKVMNESFPELGLKKEDCTEMSWLEPVLFISASSRYNTSLEALIEGLESLLKRFLQEDFRSMIWTPYGGKMSQISESEIPFPHRKGNRFMIQYITGWFTDDKDVEAKHWMRNLYSYMEIYVSRSPRAAYVNYRDLDLGMNRDRFTSFLEASSWGTKYFKDNFLRLAIIKSNVDPDNFFYHGQSIPRYESRIRRGSSDSYVNLDNLASH